MSEVPLLVSAPPVQPFESLASWISRAALSQGVKTAELLKRFGVPAYRDPDITMNQMQAAYLLKISGLDVDSFALPFKVFGNLKRAIKHGGAFVMRADGKAMYRFCPMCMSEQRVPYFPLHWRFSAWRWCPIHDCLLEAACPHCDEPVRLPAEQVQTKVGLLSYCMSCQNKLDEIKPCRLARSAAELDLPMVTGWEQQCLLHGRALLAALYSGYFYIDDREKKFNVSHIARLEGLGLVINRLSWLQAGELRSNLPGISRRL